MLTSRAWRLPRAATELSLTRDSRLRVGDREVINLCLEGYLALAPPDADATSCEAAAARLAEHKRAPSAGLYAAFELAFDAALGALTDGGGAVIVHDDGIRPELRTLCVDRADRVLAYRHCDAVHAEQVLPRARETSAPVVLVTEGVFGINGTVSPLAELAAATRAHGASTLLDDSFAYGLLGPHGSGSARHFGTGKSVDIDAEVSSLAGAFGLDGAAFAVGPGLATAGMPLDGPTAGRLDAALAWLARDVAPQERLWALTRYLREGLNAFNLDTGDTHSPVTPILCGTPEQALDAADRLLEAGVLVHVVPEALFPGGQAALRATVSLRHSEDDLEEAIEIIAGILR